MTKGLTSKIASAIAALFILTYGVQAEDGNEATQARFQAELETLGPLALKGDAHATYRLAQMHRRGLGTEVDYQRSQELVNLAAYLGHPSAQIEVGNRVSFLTLRTSDFNSPLKWFRRAADQGYAVGQFKVGELYLNGDGVQQDHKVALKWFEMAASQNFGPAECAISSLYDEGLGVAQDSAAAYQWKKRCVKHNMVKFTD